MILILVGVNLSKVQNLLAMYVLRALAKLDVRLPLVQEISVRVILAIVC